MNRSDLQAFAETRIAEAGILLQNGMHAGSYYFAGYSIECGLKAAIAKQVSLHDFPDKQLALKSHTHDLQVLLGLSGLKQQFDQDASTDPDLETNWAVVKDWKETSRYEASVSSRRAQDLFDSITNPTSGILTWLKNSW